MSYDLQELLDFEARCMFVRTSIDPSERVWVSVLLDMVAERVMNTENPDKALKDVIKTLKIIVDSRKKSNEQKLNEKMVNILGEK